MKAHSDKGFTLIELLIVIVILGILAGVVVFSVGNIRDTAATNACLTEKKTVETAMQAYYAQNGTNALAMTALVPDYLDSNPTYFDLSAAGDLINNPTADMPTDCTA